MKKFKYLFLTAVTSIAITSCSSDDDFNRNDDEMEMSSDRLFATTNAGQIAGYHLENGSSYTLNTSSSDAEGIFYHEDNDALIIASRNPGQVQYYGEVSMWDQDAASATAAMMSSSDLQSARDIAVSGNMIVVADNADVNPNGEADTMYNRFFIYTVTNDAITLRNTVWVDFKVWGIEFVNNTLYAVVDQTNKLASFDNFLSNTADGMLEATKMIGLEGIVRTHGLDYDNGTMIMSDIGSADSDADGGLHIIRDFDTKFNNTANEGMLAVGEQVRISGNNTMLGNPVNVSYDANSGMIYVAEVKNGGGRVLSFSDEASGNAQPMINNMLSGVNAVYFHQD